MQIQRKRIWSDIRTLQFCLSKLHHMYNYLSLSLSLSLCMPVFLDTSFVQGFPLTTSSISLSCFTDSTWSAWVGPVGKVMTDHIHIEMREPWVKKWGVCTKYIHRIVHTELANYFHLKVDKTLKYLSYFICYSIINCFKYYSFCHLCHFHHRIVKQNVNVHKVFICSQGSVYILLL